VSGAPPAPRDKGRQRDESSSCKLLYLPGTIRDACSHRWHYITLRLWCIRTKLYHAKFSDSGAFPGVTLYVRVETSQAAW
jgi:hypothetical protein